MTVAGKSGTLRNTAGAKPAVFVFSGISQAAAINAKANSAIKTNPVVTVNSSAGLFGNKTIERCADTIHSSPPDA